MKKIEKIGLFIILCSGFLKGMEQNISKRRSLLREQDTAYYLKRLPKEIKEDIITALNRNDNAKDFLRAIKEMSLTNKKLNEIVNEDYSDQEGFTALVHILANKIQMDSVYVASMFHTRTASKYKVLADFLVDAIIHNKVDLVNLFISNEKADVNVNYGLGRMPLCYAVDRGNSKIVQLLLDAGANPNIIDAYFSEVKNNQYPGTVLDHAQEIGASKEIIELLKKHGAKTLSELEK